MAPKTDEDLSNSDRIRVVVRCRPRKPSESFADTSIDIPNASTVFIQTAPGRPKKEYKFDYVADGDSTQEQIFEQAGRPVVDCVTAGFHGTIFAYGQTGTGKTWSTNGPPGATRDDTPDFRGVIPRACEAIFHHLSKLQSDEISYKVRASYLEIYNEKIRDLLADPNKPPNSPYGCGARANKGIFLREAASGEVLVEGGRLWQNVTSEEECVQVLGSGVRNRAVASTAMNSESSRSHAIFTIEVTQVSSETMKERVSQLHLVDLAGSERQKSTLAQGDRLKESNEINKSLTSLGNVIQALVDAAQKPSGQSHIPYRDSKLTFLLKDALGGNSKTCLIATMSPAEASLAETASTLEFAKRCSAIKNAAKINENLTSNVKELQDEVRRLRAFVQDFQQSGHIPTAAMEKRLSITPKEYPIVEILPHAVVAIEPSQHPEVAAQRVRIEEETARAERLQAIVADTLAREEAVKADHRQLESRFEQMESLLSSQGESLTALQGIIELREGELKEIRSGDWNRDAGIRRLRREIELTKVQRDNNPEVARLALELSQTKAATSEDAEIAGAKLEEQLRILTRELEAALIENGELRELATPRGGPVTGMPFMDTGSSASELSSIADEESSHGKKGDAFSMVRLDCTNIKPVIDLPSTAVPKTLHQRGAKLNDLLSTLRSSVHNLEESITTHTQTPRSIIAADSA